MTLEEARAAHAIERDGILNELHPYAGDYPETSISWHRERDKRALDAVAKDVALAAARMAYEVSPVEAIMEIERLFGSEGGEDVTSAT